MKARVKATGEIVEVTRVTKYDSNYKPAVYYEAEDGFPYKEEHIDFEDLTVGKADVKEKSLPKDEPDYWEKLKHQYAGMAMQGMLSNSAYLENFVKCCVKGESFTIVVTANAIDYATALVNRLKEKSQ